jgi:hypothetical protein
MANLSSSRPAKVDSGDAGDRVGQEGSGTAGRPRVADVRGLANITLKELIDWYCEVIGGVLLDSVFDRVGWQ